MINKAAAQRLNLSDAVEDLAPDHPPCWHDRSSWLEYLKSAAAVQNQRNEQKVIAIVRGEPTFNIFLNFCVDCLVPRARLMEKEGRCNPNHLTDSIK